MKITQLRRLDADSSTATVRTTAGQDTQVTDNSARVVAESGGSLRAVGHWPSVAVLVWLAHAWSNSSHLVSAEILTITIVKRGHFVRDVAAEGPSSRQ